MKTSHSNLNLSNQYATDNCDCFCHYPEDIDINDKHSILHQNIPPNATTQSYRPSPLKKKLNQKKNSESLCICEEICSCPCHCVTCLCCPCVKEKKNDYYKNLYSQIKSELEIEKRRSERMKYDKDMKSQNNEKEKQKLVLENSQLKKQLQETLSLLGEEEEKNAQRDEEVYKFKNDELPKLQQSYENLIKTLKEEKDKQINDLNNKCGDLSKENISLKYQIKRKENEKNDNLNHIIEELNMEINDLKNELESKNATIDKLNAENEELNSHCEELKSKFNKEMQDIKSQNLKLSQNTNSNISEIKRLKDELNRVRKNKTNEEQTYLKLKNGNQTKDNEVYSFISILICFRSFCS